MLVIPALAIVAALIAVRRSSSRCSARTRSTSIVDMYHGAFGTWFSWQNTLSARRAADAHRAVHRAAGAARPGRSSAAKARSLLGGARRRRRPALALHGAPPLVVQLAMARRRHDRRRPLDRARRAACSTTAASTRRSPACCWSTSRIALFNHWSKGRCAIRRASTSRRPIRSAPPTCSAPFPALDVHWGLVFGVVVCVLCCILMNHTTFGFARRIVGGNVRAAKVAGLGRRPAHPHHLLARPALRPASPAWSRSPPSRARANATSRSPATATPGSWSRSSPATIRSPSSRSRSCSAASMPAAACCSAGSTCPTPRSSCCRASSSSSILASETLYGRFTHLPARRSVPADG